MTIPAALLVVAAIFAGSLPADVFRPQDDLGWNQWRGANRDGLSPDTGLLEAWPRQGPPLEWKARGLGKGFSAISIAGDKIFTMGDSGGAARLFALSAADGRFLWSAAVGRPGGDTYAGTRATPSTDGSLVFALGQDGELGCFEVESGRLKWKKNLQRDFRGSMMSGWGYSESPLVDGDYVICTPGGSRGSVIALFKETGDVAWRCTELVDPAAYASLVPATIGGRRQYIVLTGRSVAGVDAADGKLLWRANRRGETAVCATPIHADGKVFVTSAYGVGCNAFRVTASTGGFSVRQIYAGRQLENHHGGAVLVDGYVYSFGRRHLTCIELETGEVVWEELSVGKGSITYADGHLVVRGEGRGAAVGLVEATPDGYREKGRFNQPDWSREPAWAHPVVYGGKLYIRDQGLLLCYDLRAQ